MFDSRGFVTVTGESFGSETILPCPSALLEEILSIVRSAKHKGSAFPLSSLPTPAENPALAKPVRLPMELWRRILNPYPGNCDRSAVAFGIAAQLCRSGLTREQALEVMSATPCEPGAER
ncbi:MAG: hypothetical protein ACREUL_17755 [Steroidobacteraceae bacterium]